MRAVHRTAVDVDRRDDVVTGGDIGRHLLDHVALTATVPKMVMRIDDPAGRIDHVFGVQREPVFARVGIEPAFRSGRGTSGADSTFATHLPRFPYAIKSKAPPAMIFTSGLPILTFATCLRKPDANVRIGPLAAAIMRDY